MALQMGKEHTGDDAGVWVKRRKKIFAQKCCSFLLVIHFCRMRECVHLCVHVKGQSWSLFLKSHQPFFFETGFLKEPGAANQSG